MPAKKRTVRLLGPYEHHGKWRFVRRAPDRSPEPSASFSSREEALAEMAAEQEVLDGRTDVTASEAMQEFEKYLLSGEDGEPNRASTVYLTMRMLATMFTDGTELLEEHTPQRCAALYLSLRTRNKPDATEPYSSDWQIEALGRAKTFHKWCVRKLYMPASGMAGVQPWGAKQPRENQPSIDEQRAFLAEAHWLAHKRGEEGAVAAMMTLLMGLRAGAIANRIARDVDDNGTRLYTGTVRNARGDVVWTPKRRKRTAALIKPIPPELQPYLKALKVKGGKLGTAGLWSAKHWRDWVTKWVARICERAKIPRYTSHDMRRAHGTNEYLGGTEQAEQRAVVGLDHDDFGTSRRHYVDAGAIATVSHDAVLKVLHGGKERK